MFRNARSNTILTLCCLTLSACIGGHYSCSREQPPHSLRNEGDITRQVVIAELGDPLESIEYESYRVDMYEYDQLCSGFVVLIWPIPLIGLPDQMLTVEYDSDGALSAARVLPTAVTTDDLVALYERCDHSLFKGSAYGPSAYSLVRLFETQCPSLSLDPNAIYYYARQFPKSMNFERLRWYCRAAHLGHARARDQLGRHHDVYDWMDRRYEDDGQYLPANRNDVKAYKWYTLSLEIENNSMILDRRKRLSITMPPAQIAEAERLAAEWKPNPEHCGVYAKQANN